MFTTSKMTIRVGLTSLLLAGLAFMPAYGGPPVPDPSAHRLEYAVRPTGASTGDYSITGTVKNVGTAAFRAGPGLAVAYLYENSKIAVRQELRSLAPGQE